MLLIFIFLLSLYFSFIFIFSYLMSLKQNKKHIKTMPKPMVGLHFTTHFGQWFQWFLEDHTVFFVGKRSNWTTKLDLQRNLTTLLCKFLLMSDVKYVSTHEEASAGSGSFAVTRRSNCTTCYQNHLSCNLNQFAIRLILPRPNVFLI